MRQSSGYSRWFVASLLSLWVVDVLVNLDPLEGTFLRQEPLGGPRNFLGLFLAEGQVAILVTAAVAVGAALAAFVLRSRDPLKESVPLLSAAHSGLTVIATTKVIWGLLTGLAVWVTLRILLNRRSPTVWSFSELVAYVLYPPLIVGLAYHGLWYAVRSDWVAAALNGTATFLLLIIGSWLLRNRSGARVLAARSMPAWIALMFAAYSSVSARVYGAADYGGLQAPGPTDRPHIILIVLDTVRADHLRRYGYWRDTMPALERWADNALVARRAVSPAGWTMPAHASLFSGKGVSEHGIHYGSGQDFRTQAFPGIRWLPDILAERGYVSLAVTANLFAVPEEVSGFERVLVPDRSRWGRTIAGFADRVLPFTARLSERLRWRMPYVDAGEIVEITRRAVPDEGGPLFVFVNILDAHSPYNPPQRFLELLDVGEVHLFGRYLSHRALTLGWSQLPEGKLQHLNDLYDGELRWIDHHLERLLGWIPERFGDDAVVIITSDHGEELGEDGRVGHEYGLSQNLIHVPLVLKGPGLSTGEMDEVINLRTLYDFIDSWSRGERPTVTALTLARSDVVISERYPSGSDLRTLGEGYGRPWVSLIEGGYKAVGPSPHELQLFDVETRGFWKEVPVSSSAIAVAFRERIDHHWRETRDRREPAPGSKPLSEEELDRLRSLGYVN
jgi:arylsulfatase A-like enzyme